MWNVGFSGILEVNCSPQPEALKLRAGGFLSGTRKTARRLSLS